jgi:hypothetical protein
LRTSDEFLADVAAIYIGDQAKGSFGSGRLIAPDLILTAGHVVDHPTREAPSLAGWKIALIGERDKDGRWRGPARDAEVVWRGKGDLDLALLRLIDRKRLEPKLTPEFASYGLVGPLGETDAAGFPDAWISEVDAVRDYFVRGNLRISSQSGPFAWSVAPSDKPDDPRGWKGMSGSAVCRLEPDDNLYLFGVVQQVPPNFSQGLVEVARISDAFEDAEFISHLQAALGAPPVAFAFRPKQSQAEFGIARLFQSLNRRFAQEYLVSETSPVPFGGRDAELGRLDEWLLDPQGAPRMLVTAPAGRGKSALLVRWMKNLQDGGICGHDGWQLAFMPISIRAKSNRPEIFYEGLARRLAEIIGDPLPSEAIRGSELFGNAVRDQLDRIGADSKKRVLVVIDGLDEALEGSFDPSILPLPMPKNVRVLLSARWQLGDHNSAGWLKRLGWNVATRAEALELDPLGVAGVKDVLFKLGAPAGALAQDSAFVERLAELTEGEPLLLRFYAEDLWSASIKGERIARADLERLNPGFDSYFEDWFTRQNEFWRKNGSRDAEIKELYATLSVLAFAIGPLTGLDILGLIERIHGITGVVSVDLLLEPWQRFVFGNSDPDTGYVLSHPRIGEYLQRGRFSDIANKMRKGFAEWGKANAIELNTGAIQPEQASTYCLQFLPEHLKKANAPPDDYMTMVENGWRLAWEELEGGQRGFARAVRLALKAQREDKTDLRLGARWRCALTLSSIKSLGQNVPIELLLAAVEKGVLTTRQAAYFADLQASSEESVRLFVGLALTARDDSARTKELWGLSVAAAKAIVSDSERVRALAALAPHLPPELLGEALTAAKAIVSESGRAQALAALAPHLPPELLGKALTAARAIVSDSERAQALTALATHPQLEEREQTFGQALAAAKAIVSDSERVRALAALAPHLPPELLGEALTAAKTIRDEYDRAQALAALAPHLPPELLGEALAAAKIVGHKGGRAEVLAALAPRLPFELLGEALTAARAVVGESNRVRALVAVVPYLPLDQKTKALSEALATAHAMRFEGDRAEALTALAPHLPAEEKQQTLGEALAAARAIPGNENRCAEALAALALLLPLEERQQTFREVLAVAQSNPIERDRVPALAAIAPYLPSEALAAAKSNGDVRDRVRALAAVAPLLPPELLGEAFAAAKPMRAQRLDQSASALVALAPRLPLELLGEALAAAKAIGDERQRADALAALAPHLPPDERTKTLGEALAAARTIFGGYEIQRARALAALAPQLPPELLGEALAAAQVVGDEGGRAEALAALAPHLPPELLGEALAAAKAVGDERIRVQALAVLAPYLPPELLGEALTAARDIVSEYVRAEALAALAPRLPPQLLGEALAAAKAIVSESDRTWELTVLIPHLPPELLGEALTIAKSVGGEVGRARALTALATHPQLEEREQTLGEALTAVKAIVSESDRTSKLTVLIPHLPPALLGEALADAKVVGDEGDRATALTALAPYLPPELLGEALTAAKAIVSDIGRAQALTAIATHWRLDGKERMLGEALAAAKVVGDERGRATALAALAPLLPPELLGEALTIATAVVGESDRVQVWAALAPYLPPELLGEVLRAVKAIVSESDRTWELTVLIPHLPPELLGEALTTAKAIDDESNRVRVWTALAPQLSPEMLGEVLTAAKAIVGEGDRAEALTALAPHLPPELLGEALTVAKTIGGESNRADALAALAPQLPAEERQRTLGEALTAAKAIGGERDRAEGLAALIPHLPATLLGQAVAELIDTSASIPRALALSAAKSTTQSVFEIGGVEAIKDLRRAINDVCRWYP